MHSKSAKMNVTILKSYSRNNNCATPTDNSCKQSGKKKNEHKSCEKLIHIKNPKRRHKSTANETLNMKKISNYFTPSPKKSDGNHVVTNLINKEESPVIINLKSNSGRKSLTNSTRNVISPNRKRRSKVKIESPNLRKISNYFTPSPKKNTALNLSNDDELPRIKKSKRNRNKENSVDISNKSVTSSYQKYGICMPSYEDILQEKKNYENYKKIIENLTGLVAPLPDLDKIQLDKKVHKPVLDCKDMSDEKLLSAYKNNLKYLDDIYYENTFCKRHELYKMAAGNDLVYNTSMILFTSEQKQILVSKLSKRYGRGSSLSDYYFKVLLPELCLKIFMDEFSVTSEEASKYLDECPVEI